MVIQDCSRYELEDLPHRILSWWGSYSSVVPINIWHIEKSFEPAPSGQAYTTGDLSLAVHELGWLYAQAVGVFLERYELLEPIESDRCIQVARS